MSVCECVCVCVCVRVRALYCTLYKHANYRNYRRALICTHFGTNLITKHGGLIIRTDN